MNLSRDYGNSVVPMLIGGQGTHKSTFCRMLLPPELREYYIDDIKLDAAEQVERMLCRMLLVNSDGSARTPDYSKESQYAIKSAKLLAQATGEFTRAELNGDATFRWTKAARDFIDGIVSPSGSNGGGSSSNPSGGSTPSGQGGGTNTGGGSTTPSGDGGDDGLDKG